MLRQYVSTLASWTSFPSYSEEQIEARRYNIMAHFHVFLPDDVGISQLLYYSMKLAEDLKEAAKRNQNQGRDNAAPKMARNGPRGAGPVRWRSRR